MTFLKVKFAISEVPAMTLVRLGINGKEKIRKVNQSVCETDFFLLPTKIFEVIWQCEVNPLQLSTSEKVNTAAARDVLPHLGLSQVT